MHLETHPLWRPFDPEAPRVRSLSRVGSRQVSVPGVVAYDAGWISQFEKIQSTLWDVLGHRAMSIDHVGSTPIPGLAAKPIIDVDLVVADSSDEVAYLPSLEAASWAWQARALDAAITTVATLSASTTSTRRLFQVIRPTATTHIRAEAAIAVSDREDPALGTQESSSAVPAIRRSFPSSLLGRRRGTVSVRAG